MFYFEDEPHDDGTFVYEAVQSLVGEVVDVAMPSLLNGLLAKSDTDTDPAESPVD